MTSLKSGLTLASLTLMSAFAIAQTSPVFVRLDDQDGLDVSDVVYNGQDVAKSDPIGLTTVRISPSQIVSGEPVHLTNCTGTLISSDVILTAAHCLASFKDLDSEILKGMTVEIYYRTLNGSLRTTRTTDFAVHPDSDWQVGANDIALLHLAAPLLDRKPVVLATKSTPIETLIYAGYGRSDRQQLTTEILKRDPEIQSLLSEAKKIPATPDGQKRKLDNQRKTNIRTKAISEKYSPLLKTPVAGELAQGQRFINLTNDRTHGCQGDSGGPSYAQINGQLVVVGVHSSGTRGACEKDHFSIMTSVDVYVPTHTDWIRSTVKKWKSQRDI